MGGGSITGADGPFAHHPSGRCRDEGNHCERSTRPPRRPIIRMGDGPTRQPGALTVALASLLDGWWFQVFIQLEVLQKPPAVDDLLHQVQRQIKILAGRFEADMRVLLNKGEKLAGE
jgi:hypothetical protein